MEALKSRLTNWKFESAAKMLSADDTTEAAEVIRALAEQFGDCGHFYGWMGDLIDCVVDLLNRDLSAIPTASPTPTSPPEPASAPRDALPAAPPSHRDPPRTAPSRSSPDPAAPTPPRPASA